MNLIKTLTGVAALSLSTAAMGQFTGYSMTSEQATLSDGSGVTVFNIFADMTTSNDALLAVAGLPASGSDPANPLYIQANGGTLYQSEFGGANTLSINPQFYPFFPDMVYDSWLTIGLTDQVGNGMIVAGDIGETADGGFAATDGALVVTPDDAQAYGSSILVAQLTWVNQGGEEGLTFDITQEAGSGVIDGVMSLQGRDAAGGNWYSYGSGFSIVVPAPGAMALLGLAGIATRRRRA